MTSRTLVLALAGTVAATPIGGCAPVQTTQSGAVGVDRSQSMLVSSEEVDKAAAQQYAKDDRRRAAEGAARPRPGDTSSACARSRTG